VTVIYSHDTLTENRYTTLPDATEMFEAHLRHAAVITLWG